jgi:anti-sigma regulatory factor (Ser/Thr protein kinase)
MGNARAAMLAPALTEELWLRAEPDELRHARRFAESVVSDLGFGGDAQFRVTLAVNEAVSNAIEHGSPSPGGEVLLKARAVDGALCFEVHDWGDLTVDWAEPTPLSDRGRGLSLMAQLVDEIDISHRDGVTVVRLLLRPQ